VSDRERHAVQAGSFGAVAAEYERGRPGYPAQALDWLLPASASRVLDLGAGTGKLTRQLLGRGLEVVAVEPSEGMRSELRRVLGEVDALAGSAEQIPLADGAVEVVLVAQAWHWVDLERAVPEVARVLAPGGRLGLVWNLRDERVDWVAELTRIIRGVEQELHSGDPTVGPPFGPIERFDVEWTQQLTLPMLLDMVASRSYVITLPDDRRAAVLADVRELVDRHPDLAGRQQIAMPYVTRCSRTHRD
jgi:SAM-dependent methyltransferase